MSDLNTREEKLKLVFAAHPQAKEIFMTSDDRAFFDEHNAEAYAQGLKDQEVKKYKRTLVETFLKIKEAKRAYQPDLGAGDTGAGDVEEGDAGAGDTEEGDAGEGDTGKGEAGADEAGAADAGDDRAALVARYQELIGKKPNNLMKLETIKAKIAEAEAK
ncbi:MAG: hypothetical protein KGZ74_08075 [Chitinophagaceae bacterium]|nr:hypothetical protein [Chitinophagaceae bacterium]